MDIRAFRQKTRISADKFLRKFTMDFVRDLILLTPVDTGYARSNWFFGLDRVDNISAEASKTGSPSINRCASFVSGLKAGGIFFIVNNVPYIMPLEYGHSDQAPEGMARVAVERANAIWEGLFSQVAS